RHLTRDTGGRDAESLRELRPAELPVVGRPQLAEERGIGEREAVRRQWLVELAREHGAQHGEVEEGVETGHDDITSTTQRSVKQLEVRVRAVLRDPARATR